LSPNFDPIVATTLSALLDVITAFRGLEHDASASAISAVAA